LDPLAWHWSHWAARLLRLLVLLDGAPARGRTRSSETGLVWGLGSTALGFWFLVSGFWFRVSGFGLMVEGFGLRVKGLGLMVDE